MIARRIWQVAAIAIALGLTGCHHKQPAAPAPVVPPPTQVPLAPTPESPSPPQVASVPVTPTPLPPKHVPKPKKPKKKPETPLAAPAPVPAAPPPNQVAAAAPPPASEVIGSLSAGGETAPAEKQKAADLIVAVEKRLAELPQSTRDAQRAGLARVRDFVLKAREALKTGDVDGASTLATKARLLLDDLLK